MLHRLEKLAGKEERLENEYGNILFYAFFEYKEECFNPKGWTELAAGRSWLMQN
jgi:hypothetical protein